VLASMRKSAAPGPMPTLRLLELTKAYERRPHRFGE